MSNSKRFVIGFAFDLEQNNVLLIEKNRPKNLAGFCNGLGGKIEADETAVQAMVREFEEECGIKTTKSDWRCIGNITLSRLEMPSISLDFFYTRTNEIFNAKTMESEVVFTTPILPESGMPAWTVRMDNHAEWFLRETYFEIVHNKGLRK